MRCSRLSRPRNSSPSTRSPRLRSICARMPQLRSPAQTCRSTEAGPRNRPWLLPRPPARSSISRCRAAVPTARSPGASSTKDERIEIEGISGTSAGALNAVLLADGLARGGPKEASRRLAEFWRAASIDGGLPELQRLAFDRLLSFLPIDGSPVQAWVDALSRFWSPYDLNPLNINPLKDVINRFVNFEALRAHPGPPLFVSATNVHTGRLRVFPRSRLTDEAVMASACLPLMFQAVEIDGVPYWDGGFLANPAIFPFFGATETEDVVLIQINPIERRMTPRSQHEIVNRINEVTFNSSIMAEFRAINFVIRLIDQG